MAYLPASIRKLEPAKVREKTEHYIRINKLRAEIHSVVTDALKPFDGKTPTKRMANAVEKAVTAAFPDAKFHVHWATDYSWYEIKVWNHDSLTWGDCYSTTLGYKHEGAFKYSQWVEKTAQYHPLTYARNAEHALVHLDQRVADYNSAIEALEKAYSALSGLVTSN